MIPIVQAQEGTGSYEANTFTLNTPLNDSVQSNPMIVSCETPPASTTFQIHYYLYDYMTKGLLSDQNLNTFTLASGATEWNFTLPTDLPQLTFLLEIEAQSNAGPGQTIVEKLQVVFHATEPAFKTIYLGNVFAVVENNPNYAPHSPPPSYSLAEEPPIPGEEDGKGFIVLTFPLLIRFPFLTNYLHYFFVIPLTIVYWTLIIFGTFRLLRLAIKTIEKQKRKETVE